MQFFKYFTLKHDLNPRYVSQIVWALSEIESPVYVQIDNKQVNAKSLIGLLSLNLKQGETVEVVTLGGNDDSSYIIDILSNLD